MSQAMYQTTKQAVNNIANALISLGEPTAFQHRKFPYPGFGDVFFEPAKPSIICRFDGIAEDRDATSELIRVASVFRLELRIIAVASYAPLGINDAYANAQNMVLDGTDVFFTALAADRTLGGLVLDVGIESSLVGSLVDPTSDEEFYGHEMVLIARVFK